MKRVSNGVITCINIVTILIAVSLIGFSVWIIVNSGSPCQRALKKPFLVFGGALLVVSLAGLVGSCCRVSILYRIYLFVLALLSLIFCIAFFLFFMIVVTNMDDAGWLGNTKEDSSSHWWSNRGNGNDEYWLREVPRRIQRYLINEMIWDEIKSCWAGDKLCGAIQTGEPLDFYLHRLPPVQSGCCKPPNYCKFQFENATIWTKPKSDPEVRESDCKKWSNVQTELCFDCESCKAAILCNVKSKWAMLAMIINLCFAIIVFTVYCKLLRSQEQLPRCPRPRTKGESGQPGSHPTHQSNSSTS